MKQISLYKKGKEFIMLYDDEDDNYIKSLNLFIGGDGYVVTMIDGKIKRLHRLLMHEDNPSIIIDHINREILDNQKHNLRKVNKNKNALNEKPLRKNNTSGFKGVTWDSINNKWVSFIMINGKDIKIGRYIKKEEAIKVRLEAEYYLCGTKYSSQRELFSKYNIINYNDLSERVIRKIDKELKNK